MSIGKYSPTISSAYYADEGWFIRNCQGRALQAAMATDADDMYDNSYDAIYDKDGFDSYGYNAGGRDRAGHCEGDYYDGSWIDDEFVYALYHLVRDEWIINDNGFPCLKSMT